MGNTPTLLIGERLGRFEITDVLAAGGQGEMYRAKDLTLGRDVAIKLLLGSDPHDLDRFMREAQIAAGLSHPHIVRMYEPGVVKRGDHDVPYLVMEFIEGTTLRERMRKASKDQLVRWLSEVADGLAEVHRNRVVHRDLKPENIMIGTDDHARIVDFGLAKTAGTTITTTGKILGTVDYLSPEQAKNERLNYRSDIFSFGTVLYEALTGEHPFRRASAPDTIHRIVFEPPYRWLPGREGEIVSKCLHKDPQHRYDDAADLARHLRELQPATPEAPPPAAPDGQDAATVDPDATTVKAGRATPLPPRFFSSRRWPLLALLAALLLAGLLVVFKQQRQRDAARPRQASTAPTIPAQARAPIAACALSGSPATIKFGESARLNWSSIHARDVVISPDIGIVGPNGSIDVSPLVTTSYEIVATNADGDDARASVTIGVTDAPSDFKEVPATGSIIATTDTIRPGGSTLLKWNSFGATSVVITPSIGIVPLQGSIQVAPKTTTTYTITLKHATGAPARAGATVYVKDAGASTQPPPSESAGITCVAATQPGGVGTLISDSTSCSVPAQQRVTQATLNYTLDAGEISVNGRNVFTKAPGAGSRDGTVLLPMDLFVPGESFLVKVVARNAVNPDGTPAGELYGRAAVHIATTVPMAGAEMGVTPGVIRRGGTAHLDWSSVDAAAVVINPVIGVVSPKGRMTVAPTDTTTYTINAISASGDPATASVTLSVQ